MRPFALLSRLLLLTMLISGSTSHGQPAAATGGERGPRADFANKTHNFGTVKSSAVVRHDFVLTNRGTETLIVTDVQPTCGCTVADTWDREIPPGKAGRIPVEFNPTNFEGSVTKTITVLTNEPTTPSHTLEFRAVVWRPVEVKPAYLYFTPIAGAAANETKIVRISSNLEQPLTLEKPESSNPALKLELKTIQPGKQFELHVEAFAESSASYPQTPITIKTSSPEHPVISIAATVLPQPAVTVGPAQIILPHGQSSNGHQRSLTIRNNRTEPMKITDASVNARGVAAEIAELQAGKIFTVKVTFPANFEPPTKAPLAVTIRTSDATLPVITVPINQSSAVTIPSSAPPGKRSPASER